MLPLKEEAAAAELARCRRHSTTARPEYQTGSQRVERLVIHRSERGTVEWASHAGGRDSSHPFFLFFLTSQKT